MCPASQSRVGISQELRSAWSSLNNGRPTVAQLEEALVVVSLLKRVDSTRIIGCKMATPISS